MEKNVPAVQSKNIKRWVLAIVLPALLIVNIVAGCVGLQVKWCLWYITDFLSIPFILFDREIGIFQSEIETARHPWYDYDPETCSIITRFIAYIAYLVPFVVNFFAACSRLG